MIDQVTKSSHNIVPQFTVGIDEAGRGSLAGPVSVGFFCALKPHDDMVRSLFAQARDSKILSAQKRGLIFEAIVHAHTKNTVCFHIEFGSAEDIDEKGIAVVIRGLIKKGLKKVQKKIKAEHPHAIEVLMDGSLSAPAEYKHQQTIIRGDALIPSISLASICAKVVRDTHLIDLHDSYPVYGFAVHKGYGTVEHRKAIRKHGLSPEHRESFCTRLV